MIWDTHMHTSFSGDSDASPESMAENAVLRGLEGICITDHLDIDYPDNPDLFLLDTDAYEPAIRRLQESFHNKLPIRFGIELGLQPHLAQTHHDILAAHDFDFVIGSSMWYTARIPIFPLTMRAGTSRMPIWNIFSRSRKTSGPLTNSMYTAISTM